MEIGRKKLTHYPTFPPSPSFRHTNFLLLGFFRSLSFVQVFYTLGRVCLFLIFLTDYIPKFSLAIEALVTGSTCSYRVTCDCTCIILLTEFAVFSVYYVRFTDTVCANIISWILIASFLFYFYNFSWLAMYLLIFLLILLFFKFIVPKIPCYYLLSFFLLYSSSNIFFWLLKTSAFMLLLLLQLLFSC